MADKTLAEQALAELITAGHGGGPACTAFLKSMAPPAPAEAPAAAPPSAAVAGAPAVAAVAGTATTAATP